MSGDFFKVYRVETPVNSVRQVARVVCLARQVIGNASTYTHNQSVASDSWVIEHNLGRHPSVTVVDSAGSTIIGTEKYIDENTVRVEFAFPFSGKAYLN